MEEKHRGKWPGAGLIFAGTIVFVVGLVIVIFKEFNIPGYYIPIVVGAGLIAAGIVTRFLLR